MELVQTFVEKYYLCIEIYLDDLVLGWFSRIAPDSHHEASLSPRVTLGLAVRVGPVYVAGKAMPDARLHFV